RKIKDCSDEWFQAQEIEKMEDDKESSVVDRRKNLWRPPPKPWLKCNVGFSWDKGKKICGAAWVIRNSKDGNDIVCAVNRPKAWPSFKTQVEQISLAFNGILDWRIEHEQKKANLGAFLIARSVTVEDRSQSYIAQGYPFWLKEVFTNESCVT
ncbi:hypothetical protein ISN44_As12g032580, partial [Arabidopsis suecica]